MSSDKRQEEEKKIDPVEPRTDPVETRTDPVETRIDQIDQATTRIDPLETRIDPVKARIDPVETRIDSVETRIDQIDQVKTRIDPLEGRMNNTDQVTTRIDDVETRTEIDQVERRIDPMKTKIDQVQTRIDQEEVNQTIVQVSDSENGEDEELDLGFPFYLEELKNEIMQNVMAISSPKTVNQPHDSNENICRICYDETNDLVCPPVTMCMCRGSVGLVHIHCLEKWLNEKTTDTCELCHYKFDTKFEPSQPNIGLSMIKFIFLNDEKRGFQAPNCLAFLIQGLVLTFLLISFNLFSVSFVHVFTSQSIGDDPFYTKYSSNLCILLLVLLINWLFSALLMKDTWVQYWIWYHWWLKTFTVKLILPVQSTDTDQH
ncbi:hypothetical protein WDU94_015307 [Cyamophila willieti]